MSQDLALSPGQRRKLVFASSDMCVFPVFWARQAFIFCGNDRAARIQQQGVERVHTLKYIWAPTKTVSCLLALGIGGRGIGNRWKETGESLAQLPAVSQQPSPALYQPHRGASLICTLPTPPKPLPPHLPPFSHPTPNPISRPPPALPPRTPVPPSTKPVQYTQRFIVHRCSKEEDEPICM